MGALLAIAEVGVAFLCVVAACRFGSRSRTLVIAGLAVLFGTFACYSAWALFRGAVSCNCYGSVEVSPVVSFVASGIFSAALFMLSSSTEGREVSQRSLATMIPSVAALILGLVTPSLLASVPGSESALIRVDSADEADRNFAIEQLNLESFLERRDDVRVLLVRESCPACMIEIASLAADDDANLPQDKLVVIGIGFDRQSAKLFQLRSSRRVSQVNLLADCEQADQFITPQWFCISGGSIRSCQ